MGSEKEVHEVSTFLQGARELYLPPRPERSYSIPLPTKAWMDQYSRMRRQKSFCQKPLSHKKNKETMYLAVPRSHRFFNLDFVQCEEEQVTQVYSGIFRYIQDPMWNKRFYTVLNIEQNDMCTGTKFLTSYNIFLTTRPRVCKMKGFDLIVPSPSSGT